jgi:hypothetical protein
VRKPEERRPLGRPECRRDHVKMDSQEIGWCSKNMREKPTNTTIQFINYVWYPLHVSALHCHPQGAFLVPFERCSIEEQSKEYCGWACCV